MISNSNTLSAAGRQLRTDARKGRISFAEAVKRIKFMENGPEAALEVALEDYETLATGQMGELIGDLLVSAGRETAARAMFKQLYSEHENIHVTNMIYADISASRALVDDARKILFIPIPKCGSSTVKNYFSEAIFGERHGEAVHFQFPEMYRDVTRHDMETTYKSYYKFSVIRDPLKRLVSYFSRNLIGGSLGRESFSAPSYMGMPTRPGVAQYVGYFHQYRQGFKDFRHHTDPICGYLDPFDGLLDRIYTMAEMDDLRTILGKHYKCKLDDKRAMVTGKKADPASIKACENQVKRLQGWYKRDYEKYFKTV